MRKVAKEYPDVTFNEGMIDTVSMKLVMGAASHTTSWSRPISSAIFSAISAPVWSAASASLRACGVGERQRWRNARTASAPDIAGKNIANPYAMTMSGQMLLQWLGRKDNNAKAAGGSGP